MFAHGTKTKAVNKAFFLKKMFIKWEVSAYVQCSHEQIYMHIHMFTKKRHQIKGATISPFKWNKMFKVVVPTFVVVFFVLKKSNRTRGKTFVGLGSEKIDKLIPNMYHVA